MDQLIKKHAEKLRYTLVGGANTAIDFGLLFVFVSLGIDKIVANYLSTTTAFIFSFFVNKNYTFKSKDTNARREFILFTTTTLSGLWILQPIVIFVTDMGLDLVTDNIQLKLIIAKLAATVVTLIWNYIFYSKMVFKK